MSFLMEQAGGQAFTGKERVRLLNFNLRDITTARVWMHLFFFEEKHLLNRSKSGCPDVFGM